MLGSYFEKLEETHRDHRKANNDWYIAVVSLNLTRVLIGRFMAICQWLNLNVASARNYCPLSQ